MSVTLEIETKMNEISAMFEAYNQSTKVAVITKLVDMQNKFIEEIKLKFSELQVDLFLFNNKDDDEFVKRELQKEPTNRLLSDFWKAGMLLDVRVLVMPALPPRATPATEPGSASSTSVTASSNISENAAALARARMNKTGLSIDEQQAKRRAELKDKQEAEKVNFLQSLKRGSDSTSVVSSSFSPAPTRPAPVSKRRSKVEKDKEVELPRVSIEALKDELDIFLESVVQDQRSEAKPLVQNESEDWSSIEAAVKAANAALEESVLVNADSPPSLKRADAQPLLKDLPNTSATETTAAPIVRQASQTLVKDKDMASASVSVSTSAAIERQDAEYPLSNVPTPLTPVSASTTLPKKEKSSLLSKLKKMVKGKSSSDETAPLMSSSASTVDVPAPVLLSGGAKPKDVGTAKVVLLDKQDILPDHPLRPQLEAIVELLNTTAHMATDERQLVYVRNGLVEAVKMIGRDVKEGEGRYAAALEMLRAQIEQAKAPKAFFLMDEADKLRPAKQTKPITLNY